MADDLKMCCTCRESKPTDVFQVDRSKPDGLQPRCTPCKTAANRKSNQRQRANDPDAHLRKWRNHKFQNLYNITYEDYERMAASQENKCLICGRRTEITKYGNHRRLNVDHCHATGKVRGLLCGRCNRGLGCFVDDTSLLRKAADYLEASAA